MSMEEKSSFSDEQIEVLRRAAAKLQPKDHAIDLRLSMPLPFRKGIYCVLLAGPEKRSKTRIYHERKRFWRLAGPVFTCLIIAFLATISIPLITKSAHQFKQTNAHPTSLPWITTEQECLGENRFWDEGSCWDRMHSENF